MEVVCEGRRTSRRPVDAQAMSGSFSLKSVHVINRRKISCGHEVFQKKASKKVQHPSSQDASEAVMKRGLRRRPWNHDSDGNNLVMDEPLSSAESYRLRVDHADAPVNATSMEWQR